MRFKGFLYNPGSMTHLALLILAKKISRKMKNYSPSLHRWNKFRISMDRRVSISNGQNSEFLWICVNFIFKVPSLVTQMVVVSYRRTLMSRDQVLIKSEKLDHKTRLHWNQRELWIDHWSPSTKFSFYSP